MSEKSKAEVRQVPLDLIRVDGGTQMREKIDADLVQSFYEDMERDEEFPPGEAVWDEENDCYWLCDGFHRLRARALLAKAHGAETGSMLLSVVAGTLEYAIWLAAGANKRPLLPRSTKDKQRAVEAALKMRPDFSDHMIANHCGVSAPFVGQVRAATGNVSSQTTLRTGQDGRMIDTGNIGKRPNGAPPGPPMPDADVLARMAEAVRRNGEPPPEPERHLCDACKGASQPVAGCPECHKVRRKAEAIAKKATKDKRDRANTQGDESVLDSFGNPVPRGRRAAFCDPWIQGAIDCLTILAEEFRKARLADGFLKRKKHFPFYKPDDFVDGLGMIDNTFDQLIDHLQAQRPAGVCPSCKGKGCSTCHTSGLVPKALYEHLTAGVMP